MGLLQLSPNGKARLIPITILYDGEFYDASAYKAAPVPMALESGTVYEAVRTGVSQGLFTVTGALQAHNSWFGQGTWQSAGELAALAAKKKNPPAKVPGQEQEAPPVLRRGGAEKPQAPEPQPSAAQSAPAPVSTLPASASAKPSAEAVEEADPNRPVLRRGLRPAEKTKAEKEPEKSAGSPAQAGQTESARKPAASSEQLIPAISDANGPDPRPYAYDLKPEEEQKLRAKILALAGEEVRARAAQLAGTEGQPAGTGSRSGRKAKPPQPFFEEVQLRAYDLSNSNEPSLVLTAKARMPAAANTPSADLQYLITLVARDDLYGQLHKAFTSITDSEHLDVLSRLDLIDVVDVDGDGRGELLFRQTSDAGKAFIVYRVIGDRLWPLFQGTPGE